MIKYLLAILLTLSFATFSFATPIITNLSKSDHYKYKKGYWDPQGAIQIFKPDFDFIVESVELPLYFDGSNGHWTSILIYVKIYELSEPIMSLNTIVESVWDSGENYLSDIAIKSSLVYPTNSSLIKFTSNNHPVTLSSEKYYAVDVFAEPNNIGHVSWQYWKKTSDPAWIFSEDDKIWSQDESIRFGYRINGNPIPNPEPATILLFGTGLAGLAAMGRRRRK